MFAERCKPIGLAIYACIKRPPTAGAVRGKFHRRVFHPLERQLASLQQAPWFAHLPDRSYRCDLSPQGSRGFVIRAEHAWLPPHASDQLTTRSQAIDGVGTYTPRDSQPCRMLQRYGDVSTTVPRPRSKRIGESPIPTHSGNLGLGSIHSTALRPGECALPTTKDTESRRTRSGR
jgi:hypothetical protein